MFLRFYSHTDKGYTAPTCNSENISSERQLKEQNCYSILMGFKMKAFQLKNTNAQKLLFTGLTSHGILWQA